MRGAVIISLCAATIINAAHITEGTQDDSCKEVAYAYKAKKPKDDVPSGAIPGERLRFCSSASTCCTPQMETSLAEETKLAFAESLKQDFRRASAKMASRTTKFDEFFQSLIAKSRQDFDEMFQKTYGTQYQQNKQLFERMFMYLETYYAQGGINLTATMDEFFIELYQKMFLVLNSQYSITEKYLSCVGGTMKEVQPFKEVPEILIQQISRSFFATRIFVQSLGVGKEILSAFEDIEAPSSCVQAISKMHVCPQCSGFVDVKPCPTYCAAIVSDCLPDVVKINALWTKFIDTMINLASRMEKQFNIEEVVEPIDLKISEAIMNFQESHEDAMEKIKKACGQPSFKSSKPAHFSDPFAPAQLSHARDRRSLMTNNLPIGGSARNTQRDQGRRNNHRGKSDGNRKKKENNGLERHIEAIKKQLQNMRPFFSQLPQRLCSFRNESSDNQCWNGQERTSIAAASITELKPKSSRPSKISKAQKTLIYRQSGMLNVIIQKLHKAYEGRDSDWTHEDDHQSATTGRDDGSGDFEGSGAISSSGDGENPIDPDSEGGDDDDEEKFRLSRPNIISTTTTVEPSQDDLQSSSTSETSATTATGTKVPTSSSPRPPGQKRRKKKKNNSQGTSGSASSINDSGSCRLVELLAVLLIVALLN